MERAARGSGTVRPGGGTNRGWMPSAAVSSSDAKEASCAASCRNWSGARHERKRTPRARETAASKNALAEPGDVNQPGAREGQGQGSARGGQPQAGGQDPGAQEGPRETSTNKSAQRSVLHLPSVKLECGLWYTTPAETKLALGAMDLLRERENGQRVFVWRRPEALNQNHRVWERFLTEEREDVGRGSPAGKPAWNACNLGQARRAVEQVEMSTAVFALPRAEVRDVSRP